MEVTESKHKNYGILNLIGCGLSKFNDEFIKEFVIRDIVIRSKLFV